MHKKMIKKMIRLYVKTRKHDKGSFIASVPLKKLDKFFRLLTNLSAGVSKMAC